MSRFTIFVDLAGRLSLDIFGGNRTTAAAVAIESSEIEFFREDVRHLPKWRDSKLRDTETAVDLLRDRAAAVSVFTVTKSTEAWQDFWKAGKPLHDAIVSQDRAPVGFVKPANTALFALLAHASALALIHAVRSTRSSGLVDSLGQEVIERTIVCDSDIKGDENIAVFTHKSVI